MLGRTGGGVPAVKAFCNPRERKSWEIVNKAASREGGFETLNSRRWSVSV